MMIVALFITLDNVFFFHGMQCQPLVLDKSVVFFFGGKVFMTSICLNLANGAKYRVANFA